MRRLIILFIAVLLVIGCSKFQENKNDDQRLVDEIAKLNNKVTDLQAQVNDLSSQKNMLELQLEKALARPVEVTVDAPDVVVEMLVEEEFEVVCDSDRECTYLEWNQEKHCSQGVAYKKIVDYECKNPGTKFSECVLLSEDTKMTVCENDEICRHGDCLDKDSIACKDSDGGLDYSNKGYVEIYTGERFYDKCEGETLIERYCPDEDIFKSNDPAVRRQLQATGVVDEGHSGLVVGKRKSCFDGCKDGACMDLCEHKGGLVDCRELGK